MGMVCQEIERKRGKVIQENLDSQNLILNNICVQELKGLLDDLGVQENVKLEVEKTHYILFKPEILHLVKKSHKLRQRASILTHAGVLLVGGKQKQAYCQFVQNWEPSQAGASS